MPRDLSCLKLQFLSSPAVLIWSFDEHCRRRNWSRVRIGCLPNFTYQDRPTFRAAPCVRTCRRPTDRCGSDAESVTGLEVTPVDVDGQIVDLVYSKLDMGAPANLFDGDVSTLARGLEANPFVLEFHFPEPRPIRGLKRISPPWTLSSQPSSSLTSTEPKLYVQEYRGLPGDPHIDMTFDAPVHRPRTSLACCN